MDSQIRREIDVMSALGPLAKALVVGMLLGAGGAAAQTCPADAGIACDSPADDDLCTDGTIDCSTGTPVCTGEGPLIYLPFEEGSGAKVGNAADLPTQDPSISGVLWTTGLNGQALRWTGNSTVQYVRIPTADAPQAKFTWAMWAYPEINGGNYLFSRTTAASSNGMSYAVNGDFWLNGVQHLVPVVLPMNSWTHLAITWDGVTVRVYHNGIEVYAKAQAGPVTWTSDIWLGQEQDLDNGGFQASQAYKGRLDDVVYYGYALSAAGVASLQQNGVAPSVQNRELCDGVDNDCNPATPEPLGQPCDGADSDQCMNGTATCKAAGLLTECVNETVQNIVEVCNFADDDCNGAVDDGLGVGDACDGPDPDACTGGHKTCNSSGGVSCGAEPIAHYTFDTPALAGSLAVTDLTSFNHEGALHGDAVFAAQGHSGKGLGLGGATGRVVIAQSATLRAAVNKHTLAAWVYPTSNTQGTLFYMLGGFNLVRKADGTLAYSRSSLVSPMTPGFGSVPQGQWSHVAAVVDGAKIRLYVNGLLVGSPTGMVLPLITSAEAAGSAYLGCRGSLASTCAGDYFAGRIDDVFIFDRVLAAAEVVDLKDKSPTWYPLSNEVCGFGVPDDDCDGIPDEPGAVACTVFYKDGDGDGYGAGEPGYLDPAAWWPMDEMSAGKMVDWSGQGVPLERRTGRRALGKVGIGWQVDGWDPRGWLRSVDPVQGTRLDATDRLSLALWVRPKAHDTVSDGSTLIGRRGIWAFGITATGVLRFDVGGTEVLSPGAAIPINAWSHVAVTYDQQTVSFWVDGVLAGTRTLTAPLVSSSQPVVVGRSPDAALATRRFDGIIDEVTVFDRIVSAAELATLRDYVGHACLCAADATFVTAKGGDCKDGLAAVHPGATETCDAADQDCDHIIDDIPPTACTPSPAFSSCAEGIAFCAGASTACSPRPFAHYRLETASTPIMNAADAGRSAYAVGLSTISGPKSGKGVHFSPAARLSLVAPVAFGNNGAVAFWIRPTTNLHSAMGSLFQMSAVRGQAGSGTLYVGIEGDQLVVKSGLDSLAVPAVPSLPRDRWHHLAVAWSQSGGGKALVSILVDGRRLKSKLFGVPSTSSFLVLGPATGSLSFDMDDLVVYDFAPADAVVGMLYQSGVPALQDNREVCDAVDNDCDSLTDESYDAWVIGNGAVGAVCDTVDSDACTDGVFACGAESGKTCQDGPIGWYNFDATATTTAYDRAGDLPDATLTGGPVKTAVGKTATGLRVSGVGELSHGLGTAFSLRHGTVAFWIRPTYNTLSFVGAKGLWGTGSGASRLELVHNSPSELVVHIGGETLVANPIATNPAGWLHAGGWTHVALTWDADRDEINLYVYGIHRAGWAGIRWSTVATKPAATASLGRAAGASTSAIFDEYGLWRRALDATEVAALRLSPPSSGALNRELCDGIDNNCAGGVDEAFPLGATCDGADIDLCKEGLYACASPFEASCLKDGPVAWYTLDNTPDTEVIESSGAGLHAERVGGVTNAFSSKFGGAQSFDGLTGRVRLPDFAALHPTGTAQTIALWVHPDSDTQSLLVHKGGHFGLRRNVDGSLSYTNRAEAFCFSCGASYGFVPKGNWSHVAVVWDGSAVTYYVNGVNVGARALTGTLKDTASRAYLGCYAGGFNGVDCTGQWFKGAMDDVLLYDYALTASDILSLVTGSLPAKHRNAKTCNVDADCSGVVDTTGTLDCQVLWRDGDIDGYGVTPHVALKPVAYWSFDVGSGSQVTDLSSHGLNGVRENAPLRRDGKVGRALAFTGRYSDSRVFGNDAPAFHFTNAITLAAWIKVGDLAANASLKPIFVKRGAYSLGIDTDGSLTFSWPSMVTSAKGPIVSAGQWVFVSATWSKAVGTLELAAWHGGVKTSITKTGLVTSGVSTTTPWGIGQYPTTADARRFDGLVDEVVLFDKALTSAELDTIRLDASHTCQCAPDATFVATKHGDCDDGTATVHPGAAELCDGIDQNCNLIIDDGAAAACDDSLACTVDSCAAGGTCSHAIKPAWCQIAGACLSANAQKPGEQCFVCNPAVSTTSWSPRADGTVCSDLNTCTEADVCTGGVCAGTALNCDDANVCTVDTCDVATGCVHTPSAGGTYACYGGAAGTKGVGECKAGTATCIAGSLGPCAGEVLPAAETCDGKDNDCNGTTDESFNVGVACDSGDRDGCKKGTFQCDGASSSTCIGDGPMVWLPFEVVVGPATPNSSWGGKKAFLQSGATQTAGQTGFGQAVALDGVNDYVSTQLMPGMQGIVSAFTLAARVKRDASGQHCFVGKLDGSGVNEVFFGVRNERLVLQMGTTLFDSGIPMGQTGIWTHYMVQADATSVRFFVDGHLLSTVPSAGATVTVAPTTVWTVGYQASAGTTYLAGAVDDIEIWKIAAGDKVAAAEAGSSGEICDGTDFDCDGLVDEGFSLPAGACDGVDRDLCVNGTGTACSAQWERTYCQGDTQGTLYGMEGIQDGRFLPVTAGGGAPLYASGTLSVVAGKVGNAVAFTGTQFAQGAVDVGQTAVLAGFRAAWVRFDAPGNMMVFSRSKADGTPFFALGRRAGKLTVWAMGQLKSYPSRSLADGIWYHLGIDVSGSVVTPYLDGEQLVGLDAGVMIQGPDERPELVAAGWNGTAYGSFLVGTLDELQRYPIFPGQTILATLVTGGEACNGLDDDCDLAVDEGFGTAGASCTGGSSCVISGSLQCNGALTALECQGVFQPVGTGCDDGDVCTQVDQCDAAGACAGLAYVCDDGIAQTTDLCNGDGTCSFVPNTGYCVVAGVAYPEGTADPGNPCRSCQTAVSQAGFSAVVDGSACSDGKTCTTSDACAAGLCVGVVNTCADGNDCTVDSCDEVLGCVNDFSGTDALPCDDGKPCTASTVCTAGICGGGQAANCDDGNACTQDGCNALTGCVHTTIPHTEACYTGASGTKGVGTCHGGTRTCTGLVLGACVGQVLPVPELCDGLDNDCTGAADEPFVAEGTACDGSDPDLCPNGTWACSADKTTLVCAGDINQAELCDGLDNNCNGLTDETFPALGTACDGADGDSCKEGIFGCAADGTLACTQDGPTVALLLDDSGDVVYTARDASGNTLDGALHGHAGFGAGVRGRSVTLDGVDDYVSLPTGPATVLGKTFTLAAYVKLLPGTGEVSVIEAKTGGCSDVAIRINAAGAPLAFVEESTCGIVSVAAGSTITKGVWHHLALTADGSKYRIYLDGALKGTANQAAKPLETGELRVGHRFGVGDWFKGNVDEVGVWRYALSATAVADLSANGFPAINRNLEICNSVDDDCDGAVDENKTAEICDGIDNNCDGLVDETFASKGSACNQGSTDSCSHGAQICSGDGSGTYCAGDAPLLWYRFETATGATVFDYVRATHGTVAGGATWLSAAAGTVGGAMRFDGTGQVTVADGTPANPGAAVPHMTLEARATLDVGSAGTIIKRTGAYALESVFGDTIRCTFWLQPGAVVKSAEAKVTVGTWHHLACVYDGGAIRLYSDGKLLAMTRTPSAFGPFGRVVGLGTDIAVGTGFKGAVDEIAVWDDRLSEATILNHSQSAIGIANIAREICDAVDNDCDGTIDEGFAAVGSKCDTADLDVCANGTQTCTAAGHMACLNDTPANGVDLCDGTDDDCDGLTDEDYPAKGTPCDGPDADVCANGIWTCAVDKKSLTCLGDTTQVEICDGLDNDCDGLVDEGFQIGVSCDGGDPDQCTSGTWACKGDQSGHYCAGDGPVARYALDEGVGLKAASTSGDVPDGVQTGASWVTGHVGKALRFTAVGQQVAVPTDPSLELGAPLSFGAWMRLDADAGPRAVMRKGPAGSPNYALVAGGNGAYACRIKGVTPTKCAGAVFGITAQSWHHALCTYDGVALKLYVQGALVKSCAATGSPITGAESLLMGAIDVSLPAALELDEVSVWDRVVGPVEAAGLFTGGDACDGTDNDCDGLIDEDFAAKNTACDGVDADSCQNGTWTCAASHLALACTGDVNVVERCDGVDNDCDGLVDEGFPTKGTPCDGPDADVCQNGTWACTADGSGVQCAGDTNQAEICDGLDNDCNGVVDDGIAGLGAACDGADSDLCTDGVTYCDSAAKVVSCDELKAMLWVPAEDAVGAVSAADKSRFAGTLAATNATFGVAGKDGKAVQFGVAGSLSMPAGSWDRIAGKAGASFAAWVKHEGPFVAGQSETAVSLWGGTALDQQFALRVVQNGVELALKAAGDAAPVSYACVPGVAGCTAVVTQSQWVHVAAVYTGTEVRLYVDGIRVRNVPATGATVAAVGTGAVLTVGAADGAGTDAFHGMLDDVLVYGHALTDAEVSALAAGTVSGDAPELCNGVDDDCDALVDEGYTTGGACDGVDLDACATGTVICATSGQATLCDDTADVLRWSMDESKGVRVVDQSGGGHDALLYGDAGFTPAGKVAGALKMVAGAGTRGVGPVVDLLGGKTEFAITAWVKPTAVSAGRSVLVSTHDSASGTRSWAFGRDGDGLFLRLRTSGDTTTIPKTVVCNSSTGCGALLSAGVWHHVGVVFKLGTARFYVDGILKQGFPFPGGTVAASGASERLMLGAVQTGALAGWDGLIDDLRIQASFQNQAAMATLYNQTLGKRLDICDGLDNDCDGSTDEEHPNKGLACDGPDSDQCTNGTWTCTADKLSLECTNETVQNIVEACDALDNDCDGATDEDFVTLGQACDGADVDLCKEGKVICNAAKTGVVCSHDGPAHLFRFDEASGATAYDSASDQTPATMALVGSTWDVGHAGKAVGFAGAVTSTATADFGVSGTATLEMWIRPGANVPGYAYSQSDGSVMDFSGFWGSGALVHRQKVGGSTITLSGPLPSGQWHHVALTMEPGVSGGLKLYIDCALQQDATIATNAGVGTLRLGYLPNDANAFKGHVDELAVYDYVLSPATLCAHKNAGIPLVEENRELCDALDNDCDGAVDEGLAGVPGLVCDGADSDLCENGTWTCKSTKIDAECTNESPIDVLEICDTVDNDCDGSVDEGFLLGGLGVGFPCDPPGECGPGVIECISTSTAGCSTGKGGSVSEVKPEGCDGKDNDCDGLTDEKFDGSPVTENCYTGPTGTVNVGTCKYGVRQCTLGAFGVCIGDVVPAANDQNCNQLDDDCDGLTDEDYVDNIACTDDTCGGGVTTSVPNDSLCDDGNPCTINTCTALTPANGGCTYTPNNTLVPDPAVWGKACQVATCQSGNVLYSVDDTNVLSDGLVCTADACAAGVAQHPILAGWCLIDGACYAAGDVNTANGCKVCHPPTSKSTWSGVVHQANFDAGGGNVDNYVSQELVAGGVDWGPSQIHSVTPTYAYYFGNPSVLSYGNGVRVSATAKSPTITLPAAVRLQLTFYVWMETEGYTGSEKFDTLRLDVFDVDAGTTTKVWESMTTLGNDTVGVFERISVALNDYAGRRIQLHFTFDSGDAFFNDYEGVYLDQIEIKTGCCLNNLDCDDKVACTLDTCNVASKSCTHSLICSECVRAQTSVVMLVDKSESMIALTASGKTRWNETKTALKGQLKSYDQRINMGAKLYPTADAVDACLVSPGLDLDFHSDVATFGPVLDAVVPSGQTPMAAALAQARAAYQTAGAKTQSGNKYVVVVTDGVETCAGDVVAEIQALRALGVKTIVVAYDTVASKPILNTMALEGGMARPLTVVGGAAYISAVSPSNVATALTTALDLTIADPCNGVDDDCTGLVDDSAPDLACNLTCASGLGGVQTCQNGAYSGCSELVVDELCDAKDNDCDGLTDEDWVLLNTPCSVGNGECFAVGSYVCPNLGLGAELCDAVPKIGSVETCDAKDNDCDGLTDEEVTQACATVCGVGTESCAAGSFVGCTAQVPIDEVCDNVDNDCNAVVDDIVPVPCVGACGNGFKVCIPGAAQLGGCSADGKAEVCDGADNDCNGTVDKDLNGNWLSQVCSVAGFPAGTACATGVRLCDASVFGACVPDQLPTVEICDGIDNDCDGQTDNTASGDAVTAPCYVSPGEVAGPAGTAGVGECKEGIRTCGGAALGTCVGAVLPTIELCDGLDNDCDGLVDEDPGVVCALVPGCSTGACLCGKDDLGAYSCYLD